MIRRFFMAICAMVLFLGVASAAQAQATRTWVSGLGDDANPCSRTAPCKTFAGAIGRTSAGGEIDVLDPGGFGTLTITKAITIDGGGGVMAGLLSASSASGLTINAGAGDRITVRNLTFNGVSGSPFPGGTGINFIAGLSLTVEHCIIENFQNFGIDFEPTVRSFLTVTDTTIENAAGGGINSSTLASTGGSNRVSVNRSNLIGNGYGIRSGSNSTVQVSNSLFTLNSYGAAIPRAAVLADGSTADFSLDNSTVSNNQTGGGVHAKNGGIVRISNSNVTYTNGTGLLADPGSQIISFGNNRVQNNLVNGTPTSTVPNQ